MSVQDLQEGSRVDAGVVVREVEELLGLQDGELELGPARLQECPRWTGRLTRPSPENGIVMEVCPSYTR